MSLIRASAHHGALLAEMHGACFEAGDRWSVDSFTAQLSFAGVYGLIAPDAGMILARVAADEAEILTLGVMPETRRQGIARRLLAGAEILTREAGAITMFLEVSHHNPAAIALYHSAGYAQVGRRKRYYHDGSDALVLRKILA